MSCAGYRVGTQQGMRLPGTKRPAVCRAGKAVDAWHRCAFTLIDYRPCLHLCWHGLVGSIGVGGAAITSGDHWLNNSARRRTDANNRWRPSRTIIDGLYNAAIRMRSASRLRRDTDPSTALTLVIRQAAAAPPLLGIRSAWQHREHVIRPSVTARATRIRRVQVALRWV